MKLIDQVKKIFRGFKESRETRAQIPANLASSNLQRNFLKKDDSNRIDTDTVISRRNQSMSDSQGKSDFSGSAYNGPGNVDREKINSNMSQRNFER